MSSNTRENRHWPRPGVSIMVFRDDRVLLAQRAKPPFCGMWSLPGGRIEAGEETHEAALRELMEETGIVTRIVGSAGTRDIILRDAKGELVCHYVLTVLVGRWVSGEPAPASDCLDARWIRCCDLEAMELTDGTADLIRDAWPSVAPELDGSHEAR